MYKKKIPFDIDCGIKITMEVIGGKWKSCIIQELCTGPKRPSELHRLFTEASPRVINQQLKELEMHGIISKKIFMELPPHSEYAITELGKTLIPLQTIITIHQLTIRKRKQMKQRIPVKRPILPKRTRTEK